jgi:hypothetical protein
MWLEMGFQMHVQYFHVALCHDPVFVHLIAGTRWSVVVVVAISVVLLA